MVNDDASTDIKRVLMEYGQVCEGVDHQLWTNLLCSDSAVRPRGYL